MFVNIGYERGAKVRQYAENLGIGSALNPDFVEQRWATQRAYDTRKPHPVAVVKATALTDFRGGLPIDERPNAAVMAQAHRVIRSPGYRVRRYPSGVLVPNSFQSESTHPWSDKYADVLSGAAVDLQTGQIEPTTTKILQANDLDEYFAALYHGAQGDYDFASGNAPVPRVERLPALAVSGLGVKAVEFLQRFNGEAIKL